MNELHEFGCLPGSGVFEPAGTDLAGSVGTLPDRRQSLLEADTRQHGVNARKSIVEPPGGQRFRYLPFLDGLRAISILMVLGFHGMGRVSGWVARVLAGWAGVDVFFVISGFLITSLLLQEQTDRGTFSLRHFYFRRCFRIWPAYYALLIAVALVHFASMRAVGISAVYWTNYDIALGSHRTISLEYLWSLAVEEQFYLLWPVLLYIVRRKALPTALALIAIVWAWRMALLLQGAPWFRLSTALDTRLDCLMMGCVAALLWSRPRTRLRIRAGLAGRWMPLLLVTLLLVAAQTLGHPSDPSLETRILFWAIRLPLFEVLAAVLVLGLLVHPHAAVTRFLGRPLMVWVGRLSYSLYLWHLVAFISVWPLLAGRLGRVGTNPWVQEIGRFLLSLLLAAASYALIEKPFLHLKKQWEPGR